MKRSDCHSPFLRGYIDAALFTTDPTPPGGCDYVDSGRADELWPSLDDAFIEAAKADCSRFEAENEALLLDALSSRSADAIDASNGSCFWYSRNGHGISFLDSDDYSDAARDALQAAAKAFREVYLEPEDFGLVTKE